MKFTFTTKGGNEYVLDLDPATSIRDTKQFFQIFYSLNSEKITIIFHNRILSDSETLSNFINSTLPGLYIISDDIHDFNDVAEKNKSNLSNQIQKPKVFFHRLTEAEATERKLINYHYQKTSQLSKIYPDKFTSFKTIILNSDYLNPYEDYSNIPAHIITADFSKTIGESLKPIVVKNASNDYNSIDKYYILRSKTHMIPQSRLFIYNLHSSSLISFNCEQTANFVNVIVSYSIQNSKKRQISYNLYKYTYVYEFKKTVAVDFLISQDPGSITLKASHNSIMVDDKMIKDYNFVQNAIIEVNESKISPKEVCVVAETLTGSLPLNLKSISIVYEIKKQVHEHLKIRPKKQIVIYNHQIIIKEYQEKIGNLSHNKFFAVQIRTKKDPVYGIEFETGQIYYFDVPDDQNVLNLKIQIRDIIGIPISHICLIYNQEILNDEATMGELSISYFSVIECKKQGYYENLPIRLKTPFLDTQQYVSPHTYVSDVANIASQRNNVLTGEKINVYIPILLFDQNTKLAQIEHYQETKFVLCEKRPNSFFIMIKTAFNDFFYLPVYPEMTIRHLISLIHLLLNFDSQVSSSSLRLMCCGIILREIYTLGQYQIKPNTIIDAYLYPY